MRVLASAILALGLAACAAQAQTAPSLNGAWVVDLSTEPGTPYTQPMTLALNADGTVNNVQII